MIIYITSKSSILCERNPVLMGFFSIYINDEIYEYSIVLHQKG
jgi:hypothetical protein